MRRHVGVVAGFFLLAEWALAAVGPQPSFYARREYGNNKGCAGSVFLAVGDINNDGIPDIACSGGQFLFGRGDGAFTLSQDYKYLNGAGFSLVDLNGDGNLDILGLNLGGSAWSFGVSFGNGDGTFSEPTLYPIADQNGRDIAVGDFNGDGVPDAVTVADLGVWLATGIGNGLFDQPILAVPMAANPYSTFRAADINQDGKLDLVVSTLQGFAILLGNGDGTFQSPVNYSTTFKGPYITVADINSDGYLDILLASTQNNDVITVYLGEVGGTFKAPYFISIPTYEDIEVGDVNGDGIPDLVSDSVYIAYGKGNGEFTKPVYFPVGGGTTANATQVLLAHLRCEKELDIITNDAFNRISVLLNRGNGTYVEGIKTALPSGLACGIGLDFNNDGIADLGFLNGPNFVVEYGTGRVSAPFTAGPSSPVPQNSGYTQVCSSNFADINGDGIPDTLIPEVNSAGTATLLIPLFGTGDGSFTAGAPVTTPQVNNNAVLVDVNGDGKADLITPTTDQIWYGNGDGTFQAPVQLVSGISNTISAVQFADLNGDGVMDLVVQIEDGIGTYILLSNGKGGLTQTLLGDCSGPNYCYDTFNVALGDVNGDGYPDLVLGNELSNMALYINNGKGAFTFAEKLEVLGLLGASSPQILDVNGDGMNDVVVSDGIDIGVLANYGNLEFRQPVYFGQTESAYYFGNWHGQSATSGLPDVMMPGSGSVTMLLNETK